MKQVVFTLLACVCIFAHSHAQFSISGRVTDENDAPLAGASVFIDGTFVGAVTDDKGYYVLNNVATGILTVKSSFLGYQTESKSCDVPSVAVVNFRMTVSPVVTEDIVVSAVRATDKTPVTFTEITKKEIARSNYGRDMPFVLSASPASVATSDAGNGIGYTGIRIRGLDSRKINVTINGVALNDAESHGVFWVNVPDIAGSSQSVQIQRGVGTSSTGYGAFGASVNILTDHFSVKPFASVNLAGGRFNSYKASAGAGTGLINGHWFFEGKVSRLGSDGYIDRGWSRLQSYFAQGGYYSPKTMIKIIAFGGAEKTFQAWYGVDSATISAYGRKHNWAGLYWDGNGTERVYNNFIDHYKQDHAQLVWSQELTPALSLTTTLHGTYGRGYYEEFWPGEPFATYGLEPILSGYDSVFNGGGYDYFYRDTLDTTDVARQLWLENYYYGAVTSLRYTSGNWQFIGGGGVSRYAPADHFGKVIWSRYASQTWPGDKYYSSTGYKNEWNSFLKISFNPGASGLHLFADLQYRQIAYHSEGTDPEADNGRVDIDEGYRFFNPKAGVLYAFANNSKAYISYGLVNREPIRSDFINDTDGEKPEAEKLHNIEAGYRFNGKNYAFEAVTYYMAYRNELVATGELNSVGSPIRTNTGESTRTGIELSAGWNILSNLKLEGNLALNKSKTDYYNEGDTTWYRNTTIAYSPRWVSFAQILYKPTRWFDFSVSNKTVGKQYLSNLEKKAHRLDLYSLFDAEAGFTLFERKGVPCRLSLAVYNIFNKKYISNGYMWGDTPYYYPQAGRHGMLGLSMNF